MESLLENTLLYNLTAGVVLLVLFLLVLKLIESLAKTLLIFAGIVIVGYGLMEFFPNVTEPVTRFVGGSWLNDKSSDQDVSSDDAASSSDYEMIHTYRVHEDHGSSSDYEVGNEYDSGEDYGSGTEYEVSDDYWNNEDYSSSEDYWNDDEYRNDYLNNDDHGVSNEYETNGQ